MQTATNRHRNFGIRPAHRHGAKTLTAGCCLANHMYPWSLQLRAVEAANAQAAAKTRRDFDARLAEQQAANEEDLDERLSAATKRVLQHNRSLQQELRMHTEVKWAVMWAPESRCAFYDCHCLGPGRAACSKNLRAHLGAGPAAPA